MVCQTCNKELIIDHVDKEGAYYYVCTNPHCDNYMVAFNPASGVKTKAVIAEKKQPVSVE